MVLVARDHTRDIMPKDPAKPSGKPFRSSSLTNAVFGQTLAYQATHVKHLICERCGEVSGILMPRGRRAPDSQSEIKRKMKFVEMAPGQLPLALLLEADPRTAHCRLSARRLGLCRLAGNEVVGACVAGLVGSKRPRSSISPLPPIASSKASAPACCASC